MAHAVGRGPSREGHLRHQLRLHPVRHGEPRGADALRAALERCIRCLQRLKPGVQRAQCFLVEAGTDIAGIAQRALLVVHAEQQRPEPGARALWIGVAADDEFLPQPGLQLDPVAAAARAIHAVSTLAHQALEACGARRGQQLFRVALERGTGLDDRPLLARTFEQRRNAFAARLLAGPAQVLAIGEQHVEHDVAQLCRGAVLERVLQALEIRHALWIERNQFAIEPAGRQVQALQRGDDARHPIGPVVAIAREAAHIGAIDARQQAISVELQFIQPLALRGWGGDQRGELRRKQWWKIDAGGLRLAALRGGSRSASRRGP